MIKVLWQHDNEIQVDGNRQDRVKSQLMSDFHIPKPFRTYSALNNYSKLIQSSSYIYDRECSSCLITLIKSDHDFLRGWVFGSKGSFIGMSRESRLRRIYRMNFRGFMMTRMDFVRIALINSPWLSDFALWKRYPWLSFS